SVAPGATVDVPLVAVASEPGTVTSSLFVTTDGNTEQVPVDVTVNGGELKFTPAVVDFGETRQNLASSPQRVEVENTGNDEIIGNGWSVSGTDFAMGTESIRVGPGEKGTAFANFLAGGAGAPLSTEVTPTTATTLCGEAPKLTLKGQRVNTNVTVNP